MIDTEFITQLKKLDLLAKKKIISSYAGGKPSLQQGRGIEPVDHREYYPGDDPKFVDWKVYGRTERLFIKRFEEEKSLTTHILVDSSNSMDFTSPRMKHSKFDYASMLGIGFAYLVTKENEKFAVGTFNDGLKSLLHPSRGRKQFYKAIDLLNAEKMSGATNLQRCADEYIKLIKTKSLAVVITDFLEPVDTIKKGLYRLARKTKNLIAVHVADPMEMKLDWQGDMKLFDLETNTAKKIFFTPGMRRDYAVRFMAHLEKVRGICDDIGADFFSVPTDQDIFKVFFDITHIASRGHHAT